MYETARQQLYETIRADCQLNAFMMTRVKDAECTDGCPTHRDHIDHVEVELVESCFASTCHGFCKTRVQAKAKVTVPSRPPPQSSRILGHENASGEETHF